MAVFVHDSFTDADGTSITSHVGETGATWTEHPNSSGGISVITNNRLRGNGSTNMFYASGVPATAEYDVEADIYFASTTLSFNNICGRMSTSANTYYSVRLVSGQDWELRRIFNGTGTTLGQYLDSVPAGTTRSVKLEIRDAAKKVYIDGVEQISSSDNNITAAGRVGYLVTSSTATTHQHYDFITGTDLSGGGGGGFQAAWAVSNGVIQTGMAA